MIKCKSMEENRYWSKYRTKTDKELAFFIIQIMVQGKKQLNSKTKFAMLLSAVDTN